MLYKKYIKRGIDFLAALFLLIVISPVLLIVWILIKVDSKGGAIYKQKRVGLHGNPFYIYKFRTMINNADKVGEAFTKKNDSRITRLGRVLRITSIDELPQIINVVKGEMSFIGPRPDVYNGEISPPDLYRVSMLPGITGLAQVCGRSNMSKEQKLKYDLDYIKNVSFLNDVKILLRTIIVVAQIDKPN